MKSTGLAQLTAVLALSVAAGTAQAQTYDSNATYYRHHHHYRHYVRNDRYNGCHDARRSSANTGTVVGAVGGGILGSSIGHGGVGSTLLGAGAGAVAGHEIGKHSVRC
jgi:outer membrane lipoprotein SlyB